MAVEPRIEAVEALADATLNVAWATGVRSRIALGDLIEEYESLTPLATPGAFSKVRVEDYGFSVEWECGVGLSVDRLWRLAREQSGEAMRASAFREWRARCGLSLSTAAEELGISRRTVAYYESGEREIPKAIALACEAIHLGMLAKRYAREGQPSVDLSLPAFFADLADERARRLKA